MMFDRMPLSNPLADLRREMDQFLGEYGGGVLRSPFVHRADHPPLNVWDAGDTVCVEAEIPGVGKDDLEVYAVGNELSLKGRRHAMEGEKLTYHRQERGTGEFTRVITLPIAVDAERIEAVLSDGVLTLRLPKERQKNYHYVERQFGGFRRSVQLPNSVDPDEMEATFTDGILTVTIGKHPDAKPKRIAVTSV